jgi:hypothetical protein
MRILSSFKRFRATLLLLVAYNVYYQIRLYSAQLPKDICYFHTHQPSDNQISFLDYSGHIEPYPISFYLICIALFILGVFVDWRFKPKH